MRSASVSSDAAMASSTSAVSVTPKSLRSRATLCISMTPISLSASHITPPIRAQSSMLRPHDGMPCLRAMRRIVSASLRADMCSAFLRAVSRLRRPGAVSAKMRRSISCRTDAPEKITICDRVGGSFSLSSRREKTAATPEKAATSGPRSATALRTAGATRFCSAARARTSDTARVAARTKRRPVAVWAPIPSACILS